MPEEGTRDDGGKEKYRVTNLELCTVRRERKENNRAIVEALGAARKACSPSLGRKGKNWKMGDSEWDAQGKTIVVHSREGIQQAKARRTRAAPKKSKHTTLNDRNERAGSRKERKFVGEKEKAAYHRETARVARRSK